jgi:ribosomal protein S12 methylthiotransferase
LGKLGAWVRLHYVYPYPHVNDVIPLMAEGLVLPYLDIPFQHASPDVLRRMRRPANDAKVLQRIRAWREQVPDLAIRSSFVVGFPGETDQDFACLLNWLEEAQLDRVGAFKFEPVEGAPATSMDDQIPADLKTERYEAVMALSARISAAKLAAKVGSTIDVLIDRVDDVEPNHECVDRGHFDAPHAEHHHNVGATGRSKADAPEIDGEVHLRDAGGLKPGDIVSARIEDADEHDLYGVPLETVAA